MVVEVHKLKFDPHVYEQDLTENGKLVPKLREIISEWYDWYSNDDGFMTPESATLFIRGATGEEVGPNDNRITSLFDNYDSDKDGIVLREEFIRFYENCCNSVTSEQSVRRNIECHHILKDFTKLWEYQEPHDFTKEQMPRYTLSHNQE